VTRFWKKLKSIVLRLHDAYCTSDDHIGVVAYTVHGDLNVGLGLKEENQGRQRAGLDMATTYTSDRVCPALPFCTQMIIDCAASCENDSYILLIADGFSWDPASFSSARLQIECLNGERSTNVHVIILGVDVEEPEIVEEYKSICTATKLSFYADISMDNIDATFRMVGGIITGRTLVAGRIQCLTMEKF
jgi:hypothetical protein